MHVFRIGFFLFSLVFHFTPSYFIFSEIVSFYGEIAFSIFFNVGRIEVCLCVFVYVYMLLPITLKMGTHKIFSFFDACLLPRFDIVLWSASLCFSHSH